MKQHKIDSKILYTHMNQLIIYRILSSSCQPNHDCPKAFSQMGGWKDPTYADHFVLFPERNEQLS